MRDEEFTCTQYGGKKYVVPVDWRMEYVCRDEATCPIRTVDGACHLDRERQPLPPRLWPALQRVGGEWLKTTVAGCLHSERYSYRETRRCKSCGIEMGSSGPVMPAELIGSRPHGGDNG